MDSKRNIKTVFWIINVFYIMHSVMANIAHEQFFGKDCIGNDINHNRLLEAADCEAWCNTTENCVAYNVDIAGFDCYIKHTCRDTEINVVSNRILYRKECLNGTYGSYETTAGCTGQCSGNCRDGAVCHKTSGVCDTGCSPGYDYTSDHQCKQECSYKTYGYHCDICPSTCNKGCYKFSAEPVCIGCFPGYDNHDCTAPCPDKTYGVNCSKNCGHCLNGQSCDVITGQCPNALCHPGYHTVLCNKPCPDKTYGENCSKSCGHCLNGQSCDAVTGQCPNALCHPGYHTLLCDKRCDSGTFGFDCAQICDCPQAWCDHIRGCYASRNSDRGTALTGLALGAMCIVLMVVLVIIIIICMVRSRGSHKGKIHNQGLSSDGKILQPMDTIEYYNKENVLSVDGRKTTTNHKQ